VVGKGYDAKTTPHMYIVNKAGTLVYAGGIDDKPTANPADINGARNHVLAALSELKAGKAVSVPTSRPYGCASNTRTADMRGSLGSSYLQRPARHPFRRLRTSSASSSRVPAREMAQTSAVSQGRIGSARLERRQWVPGRGGGAHISAPAPAPALPRSMLATGSAQAPGTTPMACPSQ
jgi:hypothetical protein